MYPKMSGSYSLMGLLTGAQEQLAMYPVLVRTVMENYMHYPIQAELFPELVLQMNPLFHSLSSIFQEKIIPAIMNLSGQPDLKRILINILLNTVSMEQITKLPGSLLPNMEVPGAVIPLSIA